MQLSHKCGEPRHALIPLWRDEGADTVNTTEKESAWTERSLCRVVTMLRMVTMARNAAMALVMPQPWCNAAPMCARHLSMLLCASSRVTRSKASTGLNSCFPQGLWPWRIIVENSNCFPCFVELFFWEGATASAWLWSQDACGTPEAFRLLGTAKGTQ